MDDLTARMIERAERVVSLGSDIDSIKDAAVERAVELYMQGQSSSVLALFQFEDAAKVNVGIAYAARVQEVSDSQITALENLSVQETREQGRLAVGADRAFADEGSSWSSSGMNGWPTPTWSSRGPPRSPTSWRSSRQQLAQLQAEID